MPYTTRFIVFAAIAIGGIFAWHWSASTPDVTQLALAQFQNSDAAATNLQHASQAQNWWPLSWPALVIALGVVLFWEDIEKVWKHQEEHTV